MAKELPAIFLSHASQDDHDASTLLGCLSYSMDTGHVWYDTQDIQAGEIWAQAIIDAIRRCAVFVVLIPPIFSQNVADECRVAITLGKPILPFYKNSINELKSYKLNHIQGRQFDSKKASINFFDAYFSLEHNTVMQYRKAVLDDVLRLASSSR